MAEEIITETNRETATDHAYGGAQIQVLEGLEAVRKQLPILSARRTDLYEVREH